MERKVTHVIAIRQHFYAGTITNGTDWELLENNYDRPFAGSQDEMREIVRRIDDEVYMLGNGECCRPDYHVTSIDSQFARRIINNSGWHENSLRYCIEDE